MSDASSIGLFDGALNISPDNCFQLNSSRDSIEATLKLYASISFFTFFEKVIRVIIEKIIMSKFE